MLICTRLKPIFSSFCTQKTVLYLVWWRLCSCVFTHIFGTLLCWWRLCSMCLHTNICPVSMSVEAVLSEVKSHKRLCLYLYVWWTITCIVSSQQSEWIYVWWRLCSCVFTQPDCPLSMSDGGCAHVSSHKQTVLYLCLMEAVLMCLHTNRLSSIYVWWRLCSCVFTQTDCPLSMSDGGCAHVSSHKQIVLYLCLMEAVLMCLHTNRLSSIYVWWRLCSCVFTQTDCPLSMSDGGCAHVSSHKQTVLYLCLMEAVLMCLHTNRLSSIYVWWRLCSCVFTQTDCPLSMSDGGCAHVSSHKQTALYLCLMEAVLMCLHTNRLSSIYVWWRLCSCVFTQTDCPLSMSDGGCAHVSSHKQTVLYLCLMEAVLMCLHTNRLSSIYVWWRLCSCVFTHPDCPLSMSDGGCAHVSSHKQTVLYLCLMEAVLMCLHTNRLSSIYVWWRLCSRVFTQTDCPLSMSDGGCAHVSSHKQTVLYLCLMEAVLMCLHTNRLPSIYVWWRLCSCVFTQTDCPLSMSDGGCAHVSSHNQIVLYLCLMEAVLTCLHTNRLSSIYVWWRLCSRVFTQTDCPLSMSDGGCAHVSSHKQIVLYLCLMEAVLMCLHTNRLSSIYVWWRLCSCVFTQTDCPLSMSDGGCAHVSSHKQIVLYLCLMEAVLMCLHTNRLSSIYVWWRLCSCVFTQTDCPLSMSDGGCAHVSSHKQIVLYLCLMEAVLMCLHTNRLSSIYVWWRLCSCVFTQTDCPLSMSDGGCAPVSSHKQIVLYLCLMEAVLMCLHTTRLSSIYVWWRLCSCVFTQTDCPLSMSDGGCAHVSSHKQIVLYLCLMEAVLLCLHTNRLSSIYVWWRLCSCVFTQTDCPLSMSDGGCAHVSSHKQIVLYLCLMEAVLLCLHTNRLSSIYVWWRLCSCVFTQTDCPLSMSDGGCAPVSSHKQIVLYLCLMEAVLMCLHTNRLSSIYVWWRLCSRVFTQTDCPLSMSDGGCAPVSSHKQIVLYLCLMEAVLLCLHTNRLSSIYVWWRLCSCVFTQTDCPLSMSDGGCAHVSSHKQIVHSLLITRINFTSQLL